MRRPLAVDVHAHFYREGVDIPGQARARRVERHTHIVSGERGSVFLAIYDSAPDFIGAS